jgi:hypothetical protein
MAYPDENEKVGASAYAAPVTQDCPLTALPLPEVGLWLYFFKLPKIPRTSARPSELATERAADFIAASTTVSR